VTERLLQGWEPELPSSDSWLLAAARNHARHYDGLAEAMGWRRPATTALAGGASGIPTAFANMTVLTSPATEPEGAEGVRAARLLATELQVPILVVSPWPTPDLAPDGFELVGHPPLMLRPAGGAGPEPPTELEITRAASSEDVMDFQRAAAAGYPAPELADPVARPLFGAPALDAGWVFFCGRVGGGPVCTAAGHVSDGVQVVELVSTLAEQRGKRYGEAITWAATMIDPTLPAMLVASDLGRPVYERMGFRALCRWTFWVALPG